MFSKISNVFLVITISLLVILSCNPSEEIVEPPNGENSNHCPGIPTVTYEGKTYNTVQIGNQCWLKENLDVGIRIDGDSSIFNQKNNGFIEKYCYDNLESNCSVYGGLYQWDEAMQYVSTEKAQGICPDGWHIPTRHEYRILQDYIGYSGGNALKEVGQGHGSGAGTNTSGFSALLAGYRDHEDGFQNYFWQLNQRAYFCDSDKPEGSYKVVNTMILNDDNSDLKLAAGPGLKQGYSVRCLLDDNANQPPIPPYNPTPPDSTTVVSIYQSLSWSCSDPDGDPLTYDVYLGTSNNPTTLVSSNQTGKTYSPGTLNEWTKYYWKIVAKDDHDHSTSGPVWEFTTKGSSGSGSVCLGATTTVAYEGKTYNTVLIGDQCWLKENLNVGTRINSNGPGDDQTDNGVIDKYCYDNNEANCDTYGGLYQWNEAMQYVTTEGAKGICPDGWHIPTYSEFETLNDAVTDDGNSLKAIGEGSDFGAGTNTSGFSALLAGNREEEGGFYVPGYSAFFWSSTAYSTSTSMRQHLNNIDENIDLLIDIKELGFSIRCLED